MPEIRKDIFGGGWVIYSGKRIGRPNDYADFKVKCPFCPGREEETPPEILRWPKGKNWQIRLVPNRYPALTKEEIFLKPSCGLYEYAGGYGIHDVLVETPEHKGGFESFSIEKIKKIFEIYSMRCGEIKKEKNIKYAMVFKNVGKNAGASLRHPHSQIIGLPLIPSTVSWETEKNESFWEKNSKCLFCETIKNEIKIKSRIVYENSKYAAFCPFASRFFFEIWIMPKKHEPYFESPKNDFLALAYAVKKVFSALNRSVKDLSYNMIIHSAPCGEHPHYHWHIEILPKLASMAGFEWGSGFHINSLRPEEAAEILRKGKIFNFDKEEK
ncbi:MAG: DUF4931 domain-containing protein [Elusimicrobia bacterium]|nr:DUF4931 domain-containing protein [Elusimicrobiota bacterium]